MAMVGWFVEVCGRRGLKVNAGKGKVMVLNGEEILECKVQIDEIHLKYVSEFKYLDCGVDESGTDGAKCSMKFMVGICSLSVVESYTAGTCYVW